MSTSYRETNVYTKLFNNNNNNGHKNFVNKLTDQSVVLMVNGFSPLETKNEKQKVIRSD